MPQLSDFLHRFRFPGLPGAPGTAVPVDRAAQLEEELAPVFSRLEEAQRRARELVCQAKEQSAALRAAAERSVSDMRVATERDTERERAAAAALTLQRASADVSAALARAEEEARRVEAAGCARASGLCASIADSLGPEAEGGAL